MNKEVLKLIKSLLALIALVLVCNMFIRTFFIEKKYWGFEELETKKIYFHQNAPKYNNLFLGSSRFYRQINPATFDKFVDSSLHIYSFNYGLHSLFAPSVYEVYENILQEDSIKLKFAFLELMNVPQVALVNLSSDRSIYWYTCNYYVFACKTILQSNRTWIRKIYGICSHTFCYFENLLNFKMFGNVYMLKEKTKTGNIDYETLGKNRDGFYSYDEEMNTRNRANFDYLGMQKNYKNFLNDTSSVTDYKGFSERIFSNSIDIKNINTTHLKKLNHLIKLSQEKGIHLFILLPPRLVIEDYKELLPLYYNIDPSHRIEVSNAKKFPQLYEAKLTFDFGHLNAIGAELFSKEIAKEFNKSVQLNKKP